MRRASVLAQQLAGAPCSVIVIISAACGRPLGKLICNNMQIPPFARIINSSGPSAASSPPPTSSSSSPPSSPSAAAGGDELNVAGCKFVLHTVMFSLAFTRGVRVGEGILSTFASQEEA